MTQLASVAIVDRIALITLDNPPVNALSASLRGAAMAAVAGCLAVRVR